MGDDTFNPDVKRVPTPDELDKKTVAAAADKKGGIGDLFNDPMAIMGLQLMASQNPRFLGGLGEAGLGTAKYMGEMRKEESDRAYKEALANNYGVDPMIQRLNALQDPKMAAAFAKMKEMGLTKAAGGIIAFADGKTVRGMTREDYTTPDSDELKARREADIAAALALQADRKATDAAPTTSSIMFDQMNNRPTSGGIPFIQRPDDFKVDTVAREPEPKPKKVYERLGAVFAPSKEQLERRGITQAAVSDAVKDDVKEKVLTPLVENTVDASGRNSLGERPGEGTRANEAPAAPVVTTKKDDGIKAARKNEAAPAVVPSSEGISKGRANIPGLSPTEQAMLNEVGGKQQTLAEILAEMETEKRKYVGPDTRPEERSKLMAEKVNLEDENARNRKLQMAQFFASWGSTPGSTLQAAMVAVNKHIPTIIAGDKEARKAQNEVDKIIRELNKAERLEKEGDFDAAYKIKTEQYKRYEDLYKTVLQNKGQRDVAQIRTTNASDEKDLKNYKDAVKVKQAAEAKYNKIISDSKSEYNKAKARLAAFKDATGDQAKAQRESAEAIINQVESEYKNSIAQAQELVDLFASRGGIKPSGDKADKKVINLDKV
jgi:hypothetical protein